MVRRESQEASEGSSKRLGSPYIPGAHSLAVVQNRGFVPAGKRLGIAKSVASRRVNDFEDRLTLHAPQAAATAALSGAAQQRSLH